LIRRIGSLRTVSLDLVREAGNANLVDTVVSRRNKGRVAVVSLNLICPGEDLAVFGDDAGQVT